MMDLRGLRSVEQIPMLNTNIDSTGKFLLVYTLIYSMFISHIVSGSYHYPPFGTYQFDCGDRRVACSDSTIELS